MSRMHCFDEAKDVESDEQFLGVHVSQLSTSQGFHLCLMCFPLGSWQTWLQTREK